MGSPFLPCSPSSYPTSLQGSSAWSTRKSHNWVLQKFSIVLGVLTLTFSRNLSNFLNKKHLDIAKLTIIGTHPNSQHKLSPRIAVFIYNMVFSLFKQRTHILLSISNLLKLSKLSTQISFLLPSCMIWFWPIFLERLYLSHVIKDK